MITKNLLASYSIAAKILTKIFLTYAVVFSIAGTLLLIYIYTSVVYPMQQVEHLKHHNPAQTSYMKIYSNELKAQGKSGKLGQIFVPFDSISKNLKNTVLAAEDDGFYTHPGFDIEAILKAYDYNRVHHRIIRGGSTITQQLAKNLFLTNERNFTRKFKELAYTLLLEKYLDKQRILELYLNYAQWGDTIFGCEAASRYYYHKPSSRLTLNEASRLAAALVNPEKINPLNGNSRFMQRRLEVIANNLYQKRLVNDSNYTATYGTHPPKDTADEDSSTVEESGIESPDTAISQ
jgi:monofunctional glycosyltransferase